MEATKDTMMTMKIRLQPIIMMQAHSSEMKKIKNMKCVNLLSRKLISKAVMMRLTKKVKVKMEVMKRKISFEMIFPYRTKMIMKS